LCDSNTSFITTICWRTCGEEGRRAVVSVCMQGQASALSAGAIVGAQRRCVGRMKALCWAYGGAVLGPMEALCWAHRIEQPFAGGRAGEAAEDGRVQGCDGSVHIGIVHLWGTGAVVSTCMQARVATDRSTFGIVHLPDTEGNQRSSSAIRHAIRHAMACHQACNQACNQPTLGSRHWSASLVSARWGWNETRRGEHLHAGRGLGGNQHAWMIRIESKWRM
jgi:hypothetical protein